MSFHVNGILSTQSIYPIFYFHYINVLLKNYKLYQFCYIIHFLSTKYIKQKTEFTGADSTLELLKFRFHKCRASEIDHRWLQMNTKYFQDKMVSCNSFHTVLRHEKLWQCYVLQENSLSLWWWSKKFTHTLLL